MDTNFFLLKCRSKFVTKNLNNLLINLKIKSFPAHLIAVFFTRFKNPFTAHMSAI